MVLRTKTRIEMKIKRKWIQKQVIKKKIVIRSQNRSLCYKIFKIIKSMMRPGDR